MHKVIIDIYEVIFGNQRSSDISHWWRSYRDLDNPDFQTEILFLYLILHEFNYRKKNNRIDDVLIILNSVYPAFRFDPRFSDSDELKYKLLDEIQKLRDQKLDSWERFLSSIIIGFSSIEANILEFLYYTLKYTQDYFTFQDVSNSIIKLQNNKLKNEWNYLKNL